eukprot:gene11534-11677_t
MAEAIRVSSAWNCAGLELGDGGVGGLKGGDGSGGDGGGGSSTGVGGVGGGGGGGLRRATGGELAEGGGDAGGVSGGGLLGNPGGGAVGGSGGVDGVSGGGLLGNPGGGGLAAAGGSGGDGPAAGGGGGSETADELVGHIQGHFGATPGSPQFPGPQELINGSDQRDSTVAYVSEGVKEMPLPGMSPERKRLLASKSSAATMTRGQEVGTVPTSMLEAMLTE